MIKIIIIEDVCTTNISTPNELELYRYISSRWA
jgi:hypothetical protein